MSERAEKVTKDLQQLPRFRDGWTFLFTERVRVEREDDALLLMSAEGQVLVPVASLSVLMLGPGSTITHAAVTAAAESGCSIVWCGENGVRFYASGLGETRHAANLMAQAAAWADPKRRLEVVSRMYRLRFPEPLDAGLSLEQIRGMEGVRVREAYARASRETGVVWSGRAYKRGDWGAADPVNRAAEVSVPAAFAAAAEGATGVETRARRRVREKFLEEKLLQRVVPDIQRVLGMKVDATLLVAHAASRDGEASAFLEEDDEAPGALWDPEKGLVEGGRNFAESEGGAVGEEQEGGEAR